MAKNKKIAIDETNEVNPDINSLSIAVAKMSTFLYDEIVRGMTSRYKKKVADVPQSTPRRTYGRLNWEVDINQDLTLEAKATDLLNEIESFKVSEHCETEYTRVVGYSDSDEDEDCGIDYDEIMDYIANAGFDNDLESILRLGAKSCHYYRNMIANMITRDGLGHISDKPRTNWAFKTFDIHFDKVDYIVPKDLTAEPFRTSDLVWTIVWNMTMFKLLQLDGNTKERPLDQDDRLVRSATVQMASIHPWYEVRKGYNVEFPVIKDGDEWKCDSRVVSNGVYALASASRVILDYVVAETCFEESIFPRILPLEDNVDMRKLVFAELDSALFVPFGTMCICLSNMHPDPSGYMLLYDHLLKDVNMTEYPAYAPVIHIATTGILQYAVILFLAGNEPEYLPKYMADIRYAMAKASAIDVIMLWQDIFSCIKDRPDDVIEYITGIANHGHAGSIHLDYLIGPLKELASATRNGDYRSRYAELSTYAFLTAGGLLDELRFFNTGMIRTYNPTPLLYDTLRELGLNDVPVTPQDIVNLGRFIDHVYEGYMPKELAGFRYQPPAWYFSQLQQVFAYELSGKNSLGNTHEAYGKGWSSSGLPSSKLIFPSSVGDITSDRIFSLKAAKFLLVLASLPEGEIGTVLATMVRRKVPMSEVIKQKLPENESKVVYMDSITEPWRRYLS